MRNRHDPKSPPYRYRYVGHRRPGWFQKKVPTWVVEAYVEWAPPMPEQGSTFGYSRLSYHTSEASAETELNRYLKTHPKGDLEG